MAIDIILGRPRLAVAWVGTPPPSVGKSAFEEQGFQALECTDQELLSKAYLHALAGVVFTQTAIDDQRLFRNLRKHAHRLLNNDCRVIVRPMPGGLPSLTSFFANNLRLATTGLPEIDAERALRNEPLPPLPHIRIYDVAASWATIANFIVEYPPGKAPSSDLVIDVEDKDGHKAELCESSDLLIRRAFYDCAEVHLLQEMRGNSGISVYRAYAVLKRNNFERLSHIKQWHLPYFIKLGDRKKVFKEYENYQNKVDPYIPFHLGPHLVHERCCLGAIEGVIVGDFIEESETLVSCASTGRATSSIACLFDRTLHGWHSYAEEENDMHLLSDNLLRQFPRKIAPSRLVLAKNIDGNTSDLDVLRALFVKGCELTPMLIGPIHGDLHAENVRVRASDAIVIDFFAQKRGPVLFDAACLESSLLIDGFTENNDKRDIHEWLRSIETLYDHVPLHGELRHINPKDQSLWFHMCVRRIRLYARQMECKPGQYAVMLALAFLIKASKDSEAKEPEASRRAVAYILAERILATTFGDSLAAEAQKAVAP